MAEGLVYIGKILALHPIDGADRIQRAEVVCGKGGRWSGVVQKEQFHDGDPCQVYLQDTLLPHLPEFAFMEPRGWRIRQMKFKGVPSECL